MNAVANGHDRPEREWDEETVTPIDGHVLQRLIREAVHREDGDTRRTILTVLWVNAGMLALVALACAVAVLRGVL